MKVHNRTLAAILPLALCLGQDAGTPDPEVLEALYPGKAYSPYVDGSGAGLHLADLVHAVR